MPLKSELEARVKELKRELATSNKKYDSLLKTSNKLVADNNRLIDDNNTLRESVDVEVQARKNVLGLLDSAQERDEQKDVKIAELEQDLNETQAAAYLSECRTDGLNQAIATMTDCLISAAVPSEIVHKVKLGA